MSTFDDFDAQMRAYETSHDQIIPPGIFPIVRLDGRGFTRLTKEILNLDTPFDVRFRDWMVATVEHLMNCGFRVLYGYTESDEISLLLDPGETAFGRKVRKYVSILAGEASAKLSLLVGRVAVFDARTSQIPSCEIAVDYFRWRQEDARRNALNGYCYWEQRKRGATVRQATKLLERMPVEEKRALLVEFGIDFGAVPAWQRNGVGALWESWEKEGRNPVTGEVAHTTRRRLHVELELPASDGYGRFVRDLLAA